SGLVAIVRATRAAASSLGALRTWTVTRRVAPSPSVAIARHSSWLTSSSERSRRSVCTPFHRTLRAAAPEHQRITVSFGLVSPSTETRLKLFAARRRSGSSGEAEAVSPGEETPLKGDARPAAPVGRTLLPAPP